MIRLIALPLVVFCVTKSAAYALCPKKYPLRMFCLALTTQPLYIMMYSMQLGSYKFTILSYPFTIYTGLSVMVHLLILNLYAAFVSAVETILQLLLRLGFAP